MILMNFQNLTPNQKPWHTFLLVGYTPRMARISMDLPIYKNFALERQDLTHCK